MANLQDIQGTQHLYEAWPIIESNEEAINAEVVAHKNTDTVAHSGAKISLDNTGKTKLTASDVQGAVNQIEEEIKSFVGVNVNAEVGEAHISTVKGKTFPDLKGRLEEIEQDHSSFLSDNVQKFTEVDADILVLQTDKADKTEVNSLLTSKANINYVDNLVGQMQSGIKGTYSTLLSLQTAKPAGDVGNYVVSSNGHIHAWDGSVWYDTGIQYQSTGIANGSVTNDKTSFIKSNNSFVAANATNGGYYNNGTWTNYETLSQSEFINCIGYLYLYIRFNGYTIKGGVSANYYVSSKDVNNAITNIGGAVTNSSTNQWIKINIPSNAVAVSSALFTAEKESFQMVLSNENLELTDAFILTYTLDDSIKATNIFNNDIIDTYGQGNNVFNSANTVDGGYYNDSGVWTPYETVSQSEFLDVQYCKKVQVLMNHSNANYYAVFKDINGNIFGGVKITTSSRAPQLVTIDVPKEAVLFSCALLTDEKTSFKIYPIYDKVNKCVEQLENIKTDINKYKGKYISILSDSISTYVGWIPSGNVAFYTGSNCGVTSVDQTWWKRVIDRLQMKLCVNNSWSSSRVTSTRDDGSGGCEHRSTELHTEEHEPDVIIVWISINDFINEIEIGAYSGTSDFPTDTTKLREAYSIMLNNILTRYKQTEVYVCKLPYCEYNGAVGFPEKNDSGVLLTAWNNVIVELANLFGVGVVELDKCGMTYQNRDIYTGDYDSGTGKGLHPNPDGHLLIANKVIKTIR